MNELHNNKLFAINRDGQDFEFDLPLKDSIIVDGKEYVIELKYDEDGLFILCNGKQYPAEIIKSKQNKFEILFNNVSYTFNIETPFSLQRMKLLNANKETVDSVILKAPMPGKIVDVLVHQGASVFRGETLVILEAMKMENEILSPIDGIIKSISVSKNSSIMKDDVLLEISPIRVK